MTRRGPRAGSSELAVCSALTQEIWAMFNYVQNELFRVPEDASRDPENQVSKQTSRDGLFQKRLRSHTGLNLSPGHFEVSGGLQAWVRTKGMGSWAVKTSSFPSDLVSERTVTPTFTGVHKAHIPTSGQCSQKLQLVHYYSPTFSINWNVDFCSLVALLPNKNAEAKA